MLSRSFIENDSIGICDIADLLQEAQNFHTRHMGAVTLHQGIDDQGAAFFVVTECGAGESLVIRRADLVRDALAGPRNLQAANDKIFIK